MEQKLVTNYFNGDSIIQLNDGRILAYYFRIFNDLTVYSQDTFEKILTIDLSELIQSQMKENKSNTDNTDEYYERNYEYKGSSFSIKELKNNFILVGFYKFLIELNIHEKTFDSKIIYKCEDEIKDVNELSDQRIIIFTNKNILIINKENNEYILKEKHIIKENWKIVPVSSKYRWFGEFKQYFSSTELPNKRLLLNSFSTEKSYNGGCGTHPPCEFSHSKIIFIDLKNCEEISSTEEFKIDAKSVVLKNLIIIQAYRDIYIYDINTLDNIKTFSVNNSYYYLYKYNDDYLISISQNENNNNLLIYKVEENNIVEKTEIKQNFKFDIKYGFNHYPIQEYNNKILFTLQDKRIILLCHHKITILSLKID